MRFARNTLIALCAALSVAGAQSSKHMLYRVKGPSGATVYLLGSVHLLTAEAGQLPAVVDTAFAHAKTVAFETNLDTALGRGQELLLHGRYENGATLRSSLSPAAAVKADSILRMYGLTLDQVGQFKPWLVSLLLSQMVMQRANFQPQYGVDMQIHQRAKSAGKTEIGFEPLEVQLGLFDNISAAEQEKMLTEGRGPDSAVKQLTAIKDAWFTGNAVALDSLLNRDMKTTPNAYAIMVVDRNRSWMPKIEELVKGKDDALVVVGAAHLIGKNGVVAMLRAKGYAVDQL